MEDFRQLTLRTHNIVRAKHGAPPLKLCDDLSAYAQNWAETVLRTDVIHHSECFLHGFRIGENISYKTGSQGQDFNGAELVMHWYDEVKEHTFGSEEFNSKTGHFTQVVWKSTQDLGVGKAKSSDGKRVFAVCVYRPAGNCLGQMAANVLSSKT